MRIGPAERFDALFDVAPEIIALPSVPVDPLKFRDEKRYTERLKDSRAKTGQQDAFVVGAGAIGGFPAIVAVQNFAFMGGSLGMAAGEALLTAAEQAVQRRAAFIVVAGSGGARMQEGILSLMQMPRSTIAVEMVRDVGLPYIVILTDPTTGGVTASFAMLGDVHIAEPGALIGFTGQRVIRNTIRQNLPEGFQRAEYLLDHGMVDMVVHRHKLRETLARLLSLLMAPSAPVQEMAELEAPVFLPSAE
jgi:acetyl-CoA carboxylase carboxyl transferase subunit beta